MADSVTRFTTEGLVIKEMNVGESDRLVTLFTRDYGIIRAFAAGAKNIKSKKSAATALLTYSSFTVLQKKGTNRIYEATALERFFSPGCDIDILAVSQYFCELAAVFGENGTENGQLLRLILNSLHFAVKGNRYIPLIKAITELRTAVISGYCPKLVACEECGKFEDGIMYFNLYDGSLRCEKCGTSGSGTALNPTLLSAMRHIVFSEFKRLYSFDIPNEAADKLSDIASEYIYAQTDLHFTSLDFYNRIKGDRL